jgi:molybdopterin-guanine dinucleotide biosynthesis protein A
MRLAGLILAGGRSSRMGGQDKAFLTLGGRSMLAHVATSLEAQVEVLAINSNSDPERFASFRYPVLADCVPGHRGPLAGILTGLLWAKVALPGVTHILSAPCDIPHLPSDMASRLCHALAAPGVEIATVRDRDGCQPTIALWPVALADRLAEDLVVHDVRSMQAWMRKFGLAEVLCSPLANINTLGDLALAEGSYAQ